LSGGKIVKRKKTTAITGTCNPNWNQALIFHVPSADIPNIVIEVSGEGVFK
jgi:hypothetical protein